MTTLRRGTDKAIVIGASIAGCLAARSLARHFKEVVLLDLDTFSDEPCTRRTVPQEHHVHLLLNRGVQIIENFYPGFKNELLHSGAEEIDLSHGVKCYAGIGWKQRWPTGITAHYCSRTLLEHVLRQSAKRVPNIAIKDGCRVKQLIYDDGTVRGLVASVGQVEEALEADLVVDASGRNSKASAWLKQLGYGEVQREEVENQLGYVSRVYKKDPKRQTGWKVLLVTPNLPTTRSMGVISPIEGDKYIVTAGGWFGASPKPNEHDFMRFLAELPVPDIHDEVSKLEPLSEFHQFKMPCSLRRRYDLMPSWPDGFLVVGDALCSINPIYSQGMSVSALQADALDRALPEYLRRTIPARQVLNAQVMATEISWQQAKKSDESLSQQATKADLKNTLKERYIRLVHAASFHNRDVAIATLKIANLLEVQRTLYRFPIVSASLSSVIARAIR